MTAPNLPYFQHSYQPEGVVQVRARLTVGPGAWSTYTVPTYGIESQDHLLAAIAAQWTADLALTFSAKVQAPPGNKMARISWVPAGTSVDIEWVSTDLRNWVGYTGNHSAASPFTATGMPAWAYYPTRPMISEEPEPQSLCQIAWNEADSVRAVAPIAPQTRRSFAFLLDNTAGADAEIREAGLFWLRAMTLGRSLTWWENTGDTVAEGSLVCVDPEQDTLAPFVRVDEMDSSWYRLDVSVVDRGPMEA